MRRSTAISQVLLLLAFYVIPLSAYGAVPSCCRRDGAHHCTMQQHSAGNKAAFSSAVHCPYRFPAIILTHATKLFMSPVSIATALPGSHEVLLPENVGRAPARDAAGLESRGPPALTL